MILTSIKFIALRCLLLTVQVVADDCFYKECYCNDIVVTCENLKLTQVPRTNVVKPPGLTTLSLSTNDISIIPAGILPPNMTEIDLTENPTETIEDTAFDSSASTLKILSFSLARFTRIPDAFLRLTALDSLTIFDTNIQDWNENAMKNIGRTLENINLENVGLTKWPDWIQFLPHLAEITMADCHIPSIPDGALDSLADSLTSLSLYNNSLTAVPKALSQLRGLQMLNLAQNKIVDVTWLPQTSKLSSLWLNNNRISDASLLSYALRSMGDSLTDLDLHGNELTAIPNVTFLTHVGGLDFSHNNIYDPFSGAAPSNLYSLDLSYNFLPGIPRFMSTLNMINDVSVPWNAITEIIGTNFPPSAGLIELGYNLISELTDTSFPENSQIEILHLNNNPIVKISSLALQNLPQLVELNLQNTKLTRLPASLASLTKLSRFDLTGSTDLVCTCTEKALEQWVLSLPTGSVLGTCGLMSIYDFFSQLSPACPGHEIFEA